MQFRNLGRSGLRVSLIGLGCNNFGGRIDLDAARKVVDAAIEHGITLFDTADIYGNRGGSELALGELLGARRKDIVLASKFGMNMDEEGVKKGGSRRYIIEAVEASLKRMKTDWIDLYQLHRPDPLTPIAETLRALEDLIRQGKIRYIGCSNLPSWQVADAYWTAKTLGIEAFASAQDEYSLLVRGAEKELIPAASHFGMGLLPYFPLANGLLTGKYQRGAPMPEGARMTREAQRAGEVLTEANWGKTEKLAAFCEARGRTLLELAFSWLVAQPVVSSVIAGATKPEQIAANVKAADWALTPEELAEIDAITG
ncbi:MULTISPECIES: aldo/keto reductase [unclassified Bosea (in: a-proteobacteria)]|uniref:aldo/keto reductase n=1 Tax=unclassified Bosea (in: a-proteobacteria) TaxID=2653178 RepID=UPI000F757EFC|nr:MULTISPECIES: aldo/keto reductase [unclassified Bosea (in: a-proteobacteria)]AZO79549.1 aldo/keto reductase [Bosea sp. Tri-49]RXT16208.1 aldo/keto reductase [Bosea sp. Tri-39]RXT39901.1 aldo/keto reductase [Bosea sp. Tri-54]